MGSSIFAFGLGLLLDVFSGGLPGLFTLISLSAFGAVHVACRFLHLQGPKGQMAIVSLAVFLKLLLLLVLLTSFFSEIVIPASLLWSYGVSALLSGLAAPLAFHLLDRLRSMCFRLVRRSSEEKLRFQED